MKIKIPLMGLFCLFFLTMCAKTTKKITPQDGGSSDGGIFDGGTDGNSELPEDGGGQDAGILPADPIIHLNHLGFELHGAKKAVIEHHANDLAEYFLIEPTTNNPVFSGQLLPVPDFSEWEGGPYFYVADFSEFAQTGTYKLAINSTNGMTTSSLFKIETNLYFTNTIEALIGFFNQSRADDPDVWAAENAVLFYDSAQTADVRGGWYDASGDISKYLSHLSYANFMNPQQIPLTAWALAFTYDNASSLLEANNLNTAVMSEALWGADYLLRVLDPEGYFYINVFDGWTGNLDNRRICAYESSGGYMTSDWEAAYREGGGMSIAALARISRWKQNGSFSSEQYLQGAKMAFEHLETSETLESLKQTMGTAYTDDGVQNIIDDYTGLMAATELFLASEESVYLEAARTRATNLSNRLSPWGYFIANQNNRPFWHGSDAGLPIVALWHYLKIETDADHRFNAKNTIQKHLEYLVQVTDETANPFGYARQHFVFKETVQSGFFIPHENESGYWWQGESARLASLSAAVTLGLTVLSKPLSAKQQANETRYKAYSNDQLNWILGGNPFDVCFLDGFGRNNPPTYCYEKPQHGKLVGGIANGITGRFQDGSGIMWEPPEDGSCWDGWRWAEQWLPHSTWFLLAITALTF